MYENRGVFKYRHTQQHRYNLNIDIEQGVWRSWVWIVSKKRSFLCSSKLKDLYTIDSYTNNRFHPKRFLIIVNFNKVPSMKIKYYVRKVRIIYFCFQCFTLKFKLSYVYRRTLPFYWKTVFVILIVFLRKHSV